MHDRNQESDIITYVFRYWILYAIELCWHDNWIIQENDTREFKSTCMLA